LSVLPPNTVVRADCYKNSLWQKTNYRGLIRPIHLSA
jgi:hypothetical protein